MYRHIKEQVHTKSDNQETEAITESLEEVHYYVQTLVKNKT